MRTFIAFTAAAFLLTACNSQPTKQQAQSSSTAVSVSSLASSETLAWETYTSEKYGFSVQHPPETTIKETDGYIRLQNYVPDDDYMGLEPGHYYLEIHIPIKNPKDEGFASCKDLVEAREVQISGLTGYRGYGEAGGDSGGQRFALCLEGSGKFFLVIATERHEDGPIANAILDSFVLTH